MVGQENMKSAGVRAAPPPGQPHTSIRAPGMAAPPPSMGQQVSMAATAATTGNQTSPKLPSPANMNTEVLNQTRKMPFCPAKAVVGGLAIVMSIAYLTLYSKKKPEASAMDVARVVTGTSNPEHTRPRN
ncbi:hypothetical protein KY289_029800 [Solanum tuberosum]|uniref:Uncharacterized protein n=1 Tax=Solanum tuberosum TaxID=4113 RepID=M1ARW8_SOLTU|nr:hypothetical protein KY284_029598 [Solanum tuberosum]KAH0652122.1 hypothetical protein KY289_029800 [Solanum tuberosum]